MPGKMSLATTVPHWRDRRLVPRAVALALAIALSMPTGVAPAITVGTTPAATCGSEVFDPVQLAPPQSKSQVPAVAGTRIAFATRETGQWVIKTWTAASGVTTIAEAPQTHVTIYPNPLVSGNAVAWTAKAPDESDTELFVWSPTGGIVRGTSDDVDQRLCGFSGGRALFTSNRTALETWTSATGVVRIASRNFGGENDPVEDYPRLTEGRVVFCDRDLAGRIQVYTWVPGLVVHQVSRRGGYLPHVSGDRIVWIAADLDDGSTDTEVFTWTPDQGVVQIEHDNHDDDMVYVSGDRIVWRENFRVDLTSNTFTEVGHIQTWTPAGGKVAIDIDKSTSTFPQVSGNRVVWIASDGSENSGYGGVPIIKSWTPSAGKVTVRTASNSIDKYSLRVAGGKVVWAEAGSSWDGSYSVWMADAKFKTSIALTAPTTCAYKGSVTLSGRLAKRCGTTFIGIGSAPIKLKYYAAGSTVRYTRNLVTSADGSFVTLVAPTTSTRYEIYYPGSTVNAAATSAAKTVVPLVSLTRPTAPASVTKNVSFTITTYLSPPHDVGTSPVTLRCSRLERQVNGSWKWSLRTTVTARVTASDSTRSTCTASLSLPSTGQWYIEAYAPADFLHAATTSSKRYLVVK